MLVWLVARMGPQDQLNLASQIESNYSSWAETKLCAKKIKKIKKQERRHGQQESSRNLNYTELWRHTVVAFFVGYVLPVSLLLPKANWLEVETYSNGIVCGISESFYFYFDGKILMEKLVKRLSETFLVIQLILIWSRVQTVFCAKRKGLKKIWNLAGKT